MTADAQYNALVGALEEFGYAIDSANSGFTFDESMFRQLTVKELLSRIHSAPLYAFDESAMKRAIDVVVADSTLSAPTIPENGVIIAHDTAAGFLRSVAGLRDMARSAFDVSQSELSFHDAYELVFVQRLKDDPKATLLLSHSIHVCGIDSDGKPSGRCLKAVCIAVYKNGNVMMTDVHRTPEDTIVSHAIVSDVKGRFLREIKTPDEWGVRVLDDDVVSLSTMLCNLHFVDLPSHYVVEECPAHVPDNRGVDGKPPKKADRFHDRERWILLDPEAVRQRFLSRSDGPPVGEHASPLPHLRRSHTRTLRSERYRFKRGAIINIRPMWVGERNWANGRLKYRVVSRPGAAEDQA